MYTAWVLDDNQRDFLLKAFPPIFPDVMAHHITYEFPVKKTHVIPDGLFDYSEVTILDMLIDDVRKVQCLIVSVDHRYVNQEGTLLHITWSIDRSAGAKPVHSNDCIKEFIENAQKSKVPVTRSIAGAITLYKKINLEILK